MARNESKMSNGKPARWATNATPVLDDGVRIDLSYPGEVYTGDGDATRAADATDRYSAMSLHIVDENGKTILRLSPLKLSRVFQLSGDKALVQTVAKLAEKQERAQMRRGMSATGRISDVDVLADLD
jgi:hypothetical protein